MKNLLLLSLTLTMLAPMKADAFLHLLLKKTIAKSAPRVNLKCKFGDLRCARKQRDVDFRRCVALNGPFGMKKCQDARKKSALAASSQVSHAASSQSHAALGMARAARATTLVPQGPVRVNSAQASTIQMERASRRSRMAGPAMGGFGRRSMVRRARDNSHLVARRARYRSNGRKRRVRRMATQGRAVSKGISAAHQRLVDQRNAMAQQSSRSLTTPRATRALPRSAYSASRDPYMRSSSRSPASFSSSPMPRESAPSYYGR